MIYKASATVAVYLIIIQNLPFSNQNLPARQLTLLRGKKN